MLNMHWSKLKRQQNWIHQFICEYWQNRNYVRNSNTVSYSSLYLYMHQNFPFITGATEGTNCQTGRNKRISILPIFIPRPSRWAWTDRATLPFPGTSRDSATVHLSFRFHMILFSFFICWWEYILVFFLVKLKINLIF